MIRDINLLPDEARKRVGERRRNLLLLAAGIAYLLLLFFILTIWEGRIGDAEEELASQQVIADDLRRQIAELAPLSELQVEYEAGRQLLTGVLRNDISWGRVLNDLSRMVPDRIWLSSLTGQVFSDPLGPLGEIQVSGVAFDYPDVGAWLRSLDSLAFAGVDGTWVSDAAKAPLGGATVVEFNSRSVLTPASLSRRVDERLPELP